MKFVHAKANNLSGSERNWFLVITPDSLEYAKGTVKFRFERLAIAPTPRQKLLYGEGIDFISRAFWEHTETLHNKMGWYMNKNGGICDSVYEIEEEIEAFNFPDDKLSMSEFRIRKWPNGKHYYIIGPDNDIVDIKGKTKWVDLDKCKEALKSYVHSRNII